MKAMPTATVPARTPLIFLAAALAVAVGLVWGPNRAAEAATGQAQAPSDRLQVWNLNTKHMATQSASCSDDLPCTNYREYVDYITDPARVAYLPDIVTLQEAGTDISGLHTPSCRDFESALEARTGVDYYCYETTDLGKCGSTTGNLGWKDAMYRACGLTGTAAYNCLDADHWTHSGSRIDFLFAKTYAIYNQDTVDFGLAYRSAGSPSNWPQKYSDHRGQGALLRYY